MTERKERCWLNMMSGIMHMSKGILYRLKEKCRLKQIVIMAVNFGLNSESTRF